MKKLFLVFALLVSQSAWAASKVVNVTDLRLNYSEKGKTQLQLDFAGEVDVNIIENAPIRQVLIEISGAQLPARLTKILDASDKNSPVLQITPYNAGSKENPKVKLVVQLREKADFHSNQIGDKYLVDFFRQLPSALKTSAFKSKNTELTSPGLKLKGENLNHTDEVTSAASASERSMKMAKQLMATLAVPTDKREYKGKSVDFEATDADVHDVFRLVGAASGLNVVTNTDVKAKVTISVKDLPWDQLLDIVLQQNNLKAAAIGNVVRIYTMEMFAREEQQKRSFMQAQSANEPIIMAIVPLSYAKADEVKKLIEAMLAQSTGSGSGRGGAGGGRGAGPSGASEAEISTANLLADADLMQAFVRGKIEVDNRSNSLVVTNTESIIDRIKKVIKELDAPTPQVLIESKIISASESFSKNIGVSWQARTNGSSGRSGGGLIFNDDAVNITPPAGAARFALSGTTASSDAGASGSMGFQLGAGRSAGLQMAINIGELNNQTKILASPRVVVNNKQKANISDGTKIALLAPAPNGTFSVNYVDATLGLDVTPQITNAGSVLLDLSIKNDSPAADGQNISSKSISTQVLVESGSTLVLGGVYTMNLTKKESGIPVLMDIPFVGNLFKAQGQSQSKSELMIFVTPRILDTGTAGISGQL